MAHTDGMPIFHDYCLVKQVCFIFPLDICHDAKTFLNLAGANLTNAVVDRVDFTKANLKNAKFHNAVVTGVTFKDADLTGATFDEALIGNEDAKKM